MFRLIWYNLLRVTLVVFFLIFFAICVKSDIKYEF